MNTFKTWAGTAIGVSLVSSLFIWLMVAMVRDVRSTKQFYRECKAVCAPHQMDRDRTLPHSNECICSTSRITELR